MTDSIMRTIINSKNPIFLLNNYPFRIYLYAINIEIMISLLKSVKKENFLLIYIKFYINKWHDKIIILYLIKYYRFCEWRTSIIVQNKLMACLIIDKKLNSRENIISYILYPFEPKIHEFLLIDGSFFFFMHSYLLDI